MSGCKYCLEDSELNLFYNEIYGTQKKVDIDSLLKKYYKKEFKLLEKLCLVILA